MLDFIFNNLGTITMVVGAIYPPALFILPATAASKINIGVKIVKAISNFLETAEKSRSGFSTTRDI